jgi:hypothetical protein
MQKTVYCCDICERETNYDRQPVLTNGMLGRYHCDWVFLSSSNGERLVCSSCNNVLRRARDLGVILPPPIGSTYVAGVSLVHLVPGEAYSGARNIAENSEAQTPYVDPD